MLLLAVALLVGVFAGQSRANLPFQNPITKSMMQNNDGSKVREIMETLDSRGEVGGFFCSFCSFLLDCFAFSFPFIHVPTETHVVSILFGARALLVFPLIRQLVLSTLCGLQFLNDFS